MAILAEHLDRDFLAMDESKRKLLGLLAEGLAFLRAIDAAQSDTFRPLVVQDFEDIAGL
jgi:hypothetical protein